MAAKRQLGKQAAVVVAALGRADGGKGASCKETFRVLNVCGKYVGSAKGVVLESHGS